MSGEEMLVIIGGLFLGYLIVTIIIEKKSSAASQKSNQNSSSFKKDANSDNSTFQNTYQQPFAEGKHISTSWYRILDVAESATLPEITIQYKRKIRDYHPDKVASLGKELKDLAELKSKEINSAYSYAKHFKN